ALGQQRLPVRRRLVRGLRIVHEIAVPVESIRLIARPRAVPEPGERFARLLCEHFWRKFRTNLVERTGAQRQRKHHRKTNGDSSENGDGNRASKSSILTGGGNHFW